MASPGTYLESCSAAALICKVFSQPTPLTTAFDELLCDPSTFFSQMPLSSTQPLITSNIATCADLGLSGGLGGHSVRDATNGMEYINLGSTPDKAEGWVLLNHAVSLFSSYCCTAQGT
jgi:hypothetical protein